MIATGRGKAGATIARHMYVKKRKLSEAAERKHPFITETTALKANIVKLEKSLALVTEQNKALVG